MAMLQDALNAMSETGQKVLILRSVGPCSCITTDGIYAGEADPHCPLCYGTAKKRFPILSEKIRTESFNNIQEYQMTFYFPRHYKFIVNDDIVVTLEHDSYNDLIFPLRKLTYYKTMADKEKVDDNFVFYKVNGQKLRYI